MNPQTQLPPSRRAILAAKSTVLSGLIRASTHLSDENLVSSVRRLAGVNQFPMGQQFLEKGLLSLKRVLGRANRRCRDKLIFDRVVGEDRALGQYFMVISGGEPFIYPRIWDLWRKYDDVWFQVYTSGVALTPANVAKLAELGNVMPCLSVEGFEAETDRRRGRGHYKKLIEGMARLRDAGIPFGFSATATRENNELVTSDEFVEFYAEQGAVLGWYFQYMPIGRAPALELLPTPELRLARYHRMQKLRDKHDILLADFWNDGPLVGAASPAAGATCTSTTLATSSSASSASSRRTTCTTRACSRCYVARACSRRSASGSPTRTTTCGPA